MSVWERANVDIVHERSAMVLRPRRNRDGALVLADFKTESECQWTVWKITTAQQQLYAFAVPELEEGGSSRQKGSGGDCLFMRTRRLPMMRGRTRLALKRGRLPCGPPQPCDRRLFSLSVAPSSGATVLQHVKSGRYVALEGKRPRLTKQVRKADSWRIECSDDAPDPVGCPCGPPDDPIVCSPLAPVVVSVQ